MKGEMDEAAGETEQQHEDSKKKILQFKTWSISVWRIE